MAFVSSAWTFCPLKSDSSYKQTGEMSCVPQNQPLNDRRWDLLWRVPFPASRPRERAVTESVLPRWEDCRRDWAGCDFNQARFHPRVINMHGGGGQEGGKE